MSWGMRSSGKKKSDITEEAVGEGRGGSAYNSAEVETGDEWAVSRESGPGSA